MKILLSNKCGLLQVLLGYVLAEFSSEWKRSIQFDLIIGGHASSRLTVNLKLLIKC